MTKLKNIVQDKAYSLVCWQLIGVLILALIALPIAGSTPSMSVLAGGLAYGLPNLIFVWLVFRFVRASDSALFMAAFFGGEVLKLISSAVLFLVIVKYLPVSLLSTLIGFIGAIVAFWVVSFWQFGKK